MELKVREFKSQAMMSLPICYKNDGIQLKRKTRSDIFRRPISEGENNSKLNQTEKRI